MWSSSPGKGKPQQQHRPGTACLWSSSVGKALEVLLGKAEHGTAGTLAAENPPAPWAVGMCRTRTPRKGIITLYSALVTSHLDTLPSLGHPDAGKTSINWREFRGSHHDGGVWSTCPVNRGWSSSACSPWSSNGFRDLTVASRACSKVTELTELGSSQSSVGQQDETQWA